LIDSTSKVKPTLTVVLGPTASGKTALAVRIAHEMNGEVISADSRQVYKGMDIGTGKDYADYLMEGEQIPCHLTDIAEPGTEYNIFRYQQDFLPIYQSITTRGKLPILCGGSGMYLEAVIKGYRLTEAGGDAGFLKSLEDKTFDELTRILQSYKTLHNKTDIEDRHRLIRAIEIERVAITEKNKPSFPRIPSLVFGISFPRGLLKKRITERLASRIENGMVQEIVGLLNRGIEPERLMRYGLEYKFGTQYVTGLIPYDTFFLALNQAIHQFSKRQMTWFRRMERQGIKILWIDGRWTIEQKMAFVREHISAEHSDN